jgi:hypothetical protein
VPNWVVGKFRCVDQGVEIGMCVWCVQSGFSQQLRLWLTYHAHTEPPAAGWYIGVLLLADSRAQLGAYAKKRLHKS